MKMYLPLFACVCTFAFIGAASSQGVKSPTVQASQLDYASPVSKHRQSWSTKSEVQNPIYKQSAMMGSVGQGYTQSSMMGGQGYSQSSMMGGQGGHGYSLTIDHGLSKEPLIKANYESQVITGEQPQPWTTGDVTGWMKESTYSMKEKPKAYYTQQPLSYPFTDVSGSWMKESSYAMKEQPKTVFTQQQVHKYSPVFSAIKAQPWIETMPMAVHHQLMMPMAHKHIEHHHFAPTPAMGPLVMPLAANPVYHGAAYAHLPLVGHQTFVKNVQPWSMGYSTYTQPELHVAKVTKQYTTGGWTAPLAPEVDSQLVKFDRFGSLSTAGKVNVDSQNSVRVDKSFEGISQVKTD